MTGKEMKRYVQCMSDDAVFEIRSIIDDHWKPLCKEDIRVVCATTPAEADELMRKAGL